MKKHLIFLALLAPLLLFNSCTKSCNDPDAVNLNSNETCRFEGRAVLWYGEATSQKLVNEGAQSLTYYVDGEIVGSSSASVFWNGSPECGQNGSVTVTKDLGTTRGKSFTYEIVDNTGFTYWDGILNFEANTCFALELQ